MIYKDICTKRTYTANGQEKTIWLNVGTYRKTDDGKEFLELNMFPDTSFYLFEKKAKYPVIAPTSPVESTSDQERIVATSGAKLTTKDATAIEYPENTISLDDIGF
jgi:hypothetical protein